MPVEVPAQIYYVPHVENQVQVAPGTNWDFSRTALQTPIVGLPDPEPVYVAAPVVAAPVVVPVRYQPADGVPAGDPALSLSFNANDAIVAKARQQALRALPTDTAWVVVAHADETEVHADRVSRARARAVTSLLRQSGHRVVVSKSLGADRPVVGPEAAAPANRTVDVYPAAGGSA